MRNFRWMAVLLIGSLTFALGCPPAEDDPEVTSFDVELAGENENPAVATPASGTMEVSFNEETNVLSVEGSFENLVAQLLEIEGSSAHIHVGGTNEDGPVVFNVDVDADEDRRSGTFTFEQELGADQVQVFRDGQYYLNIHTNAYPGGELRGQLVEDAPEFAGLDQSWGVELTETLHPHDVDTDADGWVWAILRDDDTFVVSGAVQNLEGDLENVTIERGAAGETGAIVFTLNFEERDGNDGVYRFWLNETLSEAQREDLLDGGFYLNVITSEYPEGELRGQFDDDNGFFVNIWEDIFGHSPDEITEAPPF